MEAADMSKRVTRKWPGLGPCIFEIDYENLFEAYKAKDEDRPTSAPMPEVKNNELTAEVEVTNTDHHKSIVKNRNEYYTSFKTRFSKSIHTIMTSFDALRVDEQAFNQYWNQNLKEITQKHI
jgi:hypothetical protein